MAASTGHHTCGSEFGCPTIARAFLHGCHTANCETCVGVDQPTAKPRRLLQVLDVGILLLLLLPLPRPPAPRGGGGGICTAVGYCPPASPCAVLHRSRSPSSVASRLPSSLEVIPGGWQTTNLYLEAKCVMKMTMRDGVCDNV